MKLWIVGALLAGVSLAATSQKMPAATKAEVMDFLARHPDVAAREVPNNVTAYDNCRRSRPLELYILQDGTSSFKSLLTESKKLLPTVLNNLAKKFPDFRGGLSLFADKRWPKDKGTPCYSQVVEMTDDITALSKACSKIKYLGASTTDHGWDENSIETLAFTAGSHGGFSKPDERDDVVRIAIVITDTYGRMMTTPPGPATPNLADELICEVGIDGPPAWQVADILKEAKVHPLPIITEKYTDNLISWWKMVLFDEAYMNLDEDFGLVVPFEAKAKNMIDAVESGVLALHCQIEEIMDMTTTSTTTTTTTPTTTTPTTTTPTTTTPTTTTPTTTTPTTTTPTTTTPTTTTAPPTTTPTTTTSTTTTTAPPTTTTTTKPTTTATPLSSSTTTHTTSYTSRTATTAKVVSTLAKTSTTTAPKTAAKTTTASTTCKSQPHTTAGDDGNCAPKEPPCEESCKCSDPTNCYCCQRPQLILRVADRPKSLHVDLSNN